MRAHENNFGYKTECLRVCPDLTRFSLGQASLSRCSNLGTVSHCLAWCTAEISGVTMLLKSFNTEMCKAVASQGVPRFSFRAASLANHSAQGPWSRLSSHLCPLYFRLLGGWLTAHRSPVTPTHQSCHMLSKTQHNHFLSPGD